MDAAHHLPILLAVLLFAFPPRAASSLKVGDRAPDFALADQDGKMVRLSDYRGKRSVVLAFYLRASTPGWTKELKAYQGDIAGFNAARAQVIGISLDSRERNRKFAQEIGATFPLLSDTEKTAARAYGVLNFTHLFANRVTFVIDREGVIRHIDRGSEALDPANARQACSLLEHGKQ
jgi:thioredoxin-dependent peroxiredoxin